jgi:predicted CXXCH cytochrome family protein
MSATRAGKRSEVLCVLAVIVGLSGSPASSTAGMRPQRRSLADMLRRGPGFANHPVHVVPSGNVTIPDGWPLDPNGAITCLTCHQAVPPLNGSSEPYLRDYEDDTGDHAEFCMKCHTTGGRSSGSMHWMAVRAAHPRNQGGGDWEVSGTLDSETRRCLGCHDGIGASEAGNPTPWNPGSGSLGDARRNHPVGVSYRAGARRAREVPLRPASLLPAEVRLPSGQVGCVSCHNLYAGDHNLLTVPIEGSALCFTCHQMD